MTERNPVVDLNAIAQKLLMMRKDCAERARGELRAVRPERYQRTGGRSGDADYEDTSESVHLGLVHLNDSTCRAIDQALRRIEAGTYGVCGNCENEISIHRLRVAPESTLCVECKGREETQVGRTASRIPRARRPRASLRIAYARP